MQPRPGVRAARARRGREAAGRGPTCLARGRSVRLRVASGAWPGAPSACRTALPPVSQPAHPPGPLRCWPPAGLPLAIATGGSRPQVTKSLAAVGLLEGFFDAIVTCNDVTHGAGSG